MEEIPFTSVICIGAGISGVCLGAQLKRQLGVTDIHFYDRESASGGTWYLNTYPGCACDVPTAFYSFSFELNPDWTQFLCSSTEIYSYIRAVADKYDLSSKMTFNTECQSADWIDESKRWRVYLRDVKTGRMLVHECAILFSAVGGFGAPNMDIGVPGMDSFQGKLFHSARWDHAVELDDKEVIIIGNGCSATQIVPMITPRTRSIKQFIRSPHWIHPPTNFNYSDRQKWILRNIPGAMRLYRSLIFALCEERVPSFYMNAYGAFVRGRLEKETREYMTKTAPEKYHDIIVPKWSIGCKRRIFDATPSYMEALNNPKLYLTNEPLVEFTATGVSTAKEHYTADVIVLATGFATNHGISPIELRGKHGKLLSEHWKTFGGPEAYDCCAINGFPNFFMLYGPNSATGHTSILFTVESTVNLAIKMISPILRKEALSVEVTAEAEKRHSAMLQDSLKHRVWNAACNTWYISPQGWNSTVYPWSQVYYWWRSYWPTWSDWDISYTRPHEILFVRRAFLAAVAIAVVAFILLQLQLF